MSPPWSEYKRDYQTGQASCEHWLDGKRRPCPPHCPIQSNPIQTWDNSKALPWKRRQTAKVEGWAEHALGPTLLLLTLTIVPLIIGITIGAILL